MIGDLYHWSPRARRKGIERRGLMPGQRAVCTGSRPDLRNYATWDDTWRQESVCFAPSPRAAWRLSGGIFAVPGETWDLWQTRLVPTDLVTTLVYDGDVQEVRVQNRIPKGRLWWTAERLC